MKVIITLNPVILQLEDEDLARMTWADWSCLRMAAQIREETNVHDVLEWVQAQFQKESENT